MSAICTGGDARLEQDLHWNRSLISFAASLGLLMYGLSAPISGWLMNRFSIRFVLLIGLILSGISMMISTQMTQIWQLNLFWRIGRRSTLKLWY